MSDCSTLQCHKCFGGSGYTLAHVSCFAHAVQVQRGTAKPLESTISVRVSDKISELELIDLPMLPSLKRNGSVSQCYERVSGSDPAHQQKQKQTDPKADTSALKDTSARAQREGEHTHDW